MVMATQPAWLVHEKWDTVTVNGKQLARVTGRERCPSNLTSNWLWLVQNTYEQQVSEAPWFHADWPEWERELVWSYYRNPLQNARLFLWGWADRNYTVEVIEGDPDPFTIQRNDKMWPDGKPGRGYQRTRLTLLDGSESRDFISYCSDTLVYYYGTQPTGIYGAKINFPKGYP